MSQEVKRLFRGFSVHCWSPDRKQLAFSPNTHEVIIYNTPSDNQEEWTRAHTLSEHTEVISGIDWAPATNSLVTCSHDRNAYVWTFDDSENVWKPKLVILRINRAATGVKWSPRGDKFAVSSGAKCVPVCNYEQSNDWWVSKMIKKHKSTVTSLAWCPNNQLLVTGSTDFKCRVFSAFVKEVDEKANASEHADLFEDKAVNKFGECLATFDVGHGWVNGVAWSPDSMSIAFTSHGSSISFVSLNAGQAPSVQTIHIRELPFLDVGFMDDNTVVAAGFEMNPCVFNRESDGWAMQGYCDKAPEKAKKKVSSGFASARAMFGARVDKGQSKPGSSTEGSKPLKFTHKNNIVNWAHFGDGIFSTAAHDGRIVFWDLSKITF